MGVTLHEGHRERHRYLVVNFYNHLHPHQILEALLFAAIPRRDTNPLAHSLIDHCGSLEKVFSADEKELMEVKGIGQHTASFLSAFGQIYKVIGDNRRLPTISAGDVFVFQAFLYSVFEDSDKEQLFTAALDNSFAVADWEIYDFGLIKGNSAGFAASKTPLFNNGPCIMAKYRPDGDFDMNEEWAFAHKVATLLPKMSQLKRYILLSEETITYIDI